MNTQPRSLVRNSLDLLKDWLQNFCGNYGLYTPPFSHYCVAAQYTSSLLVQHRTALLYCNENKFLPNIIIIYSRNN